MRKDWASTIPPRDVYKRQVVNGVCERCGSEVVHKVKSQWMLKITEYAQRLLDDLDTVDYIDRVKISQRIWIGRSTGAQEMCIRDRV